MKHMSVRRLAFTGLLAAVYAALTMGLAFMSYGQLQFRVAEALCVLPFFFPFTTWGLTIGCLLANLLSPVGILDIVFGSLATLISCLCTAALGRSEQWRSWPRNILACLMPVFWNALIIGAIITLSTTTEIYSAPAWLIFAGNAVSVGFGELVVMFILGLPLIRSLPQKAVFRQLWRKLT